MLPAEDRYRLVIPVGAPGQRDDVLIDTFGEGNPRRRRGVGATLQAHHSLSLPFTSLGSHDNEPRQNRPAWGLEIALLALRPYTCGSAAEGTPRRAPTPWRGRSGVFFPWRLSKNLGGSPRTCPRRSGGWRFISFTEHCSLFTALWLWYPCSIPLGSHACT